MSKTAILIDGGFYRKRAKHLWGDKTAIDRSLELIAYCKDHLKDTDGKQKETYIESSTMIVFPMKNLCFIHILRKIVA